MEHMPELSRIAGGAIQERFEIEFQKVLDNLMDPNTDPKKARKVQVTLVCKTDEDRNMTTVQIEAKSTLAPASTISTKFLMDRDGDGQAVGAEFVQTRLFEDTEPKGPREVDKVSYLK